MNGMSTGCFLLVKRVQQITLTWWHLAISCTTSSIGLIFVVTATKGGNSSIRNTDIYIYCHITQKGGFSGTHGETGSKMKPIGLWFLRRLYWLKNGVIMLNTIIYLITRVFDL